MSEGDTQRPPDEPAPPSSSLGLEAPVISALRPLAAAALPALILGRALAPALKGAGLGSGDVVGAVEIAGSIASQTFSMAAMMAAILAVMATARSRLPIGVRIGALTLGGFAVLPTVWALHQPVPDLSATLVATCASLLALVAAPTALRAPYARAAGLTLLFIGLGGIVRLVAVQVALSGTRSLGAAQAVATGALACDAVAIFVALAWVASRGGRASLARPPVLVALALALVCTRAALAGRGDDAHGVALLTWRAAGRLATHPDALLPVGLRVFLAFLAPFTAAAALLSRGPVATLGAAIALSLLAHGAAEMPPCALMLLLASLGSALSVHEGRGLWARLEPVRR